MKLYIARHGQTELNKKHVLQGNTDSPLTDIGVEGAERLRDALRDIDFDLVLTSTLGRAIRTTEIILDGRQEEIIQTPAVGEMTFGVWQGKTKEEICTSAEEEERYINYFRHPEKYIPVEGGESYQQILDRSAGFLSEMLKYAEANPDANVLLVSHGAFIKAFMAVIKGVAIEDYWMEPTITNCSLTIIEIKGGRCQIALEGDTEHLGSAKIPMVQSGYLK